MGSDQSGHLHNRAGVVLTVVAAAVTAFGIFGVRAGAEEGKLVPPPAMNEPSAPAMRSETAVFAGGCFWGVQGVFQHVKGVTNAVSGYAGGKAADAHYQTVSTGETGHAESVQVTFDPAQVSYGKLLQIYFSVAHDPTSFNFQGPDHGTQYRSTVFPMSEAQAKVATSYIAQLNGAHVFSEPVVTTIEMGRQFFPAESYHQNYLTLNPHYPYIAMNDIPKIENLERLFPESYRTDPVLVATAGASN
jgi:peptide-methionine (S)-S-oxide reductase